MKRRTFIAFVGGAVTAWKHDAQAQQRRLPLVVVLSPRAATINVGALRRGLQDLGYIEGQNIALEVRSADGDNTRLPSLAAEIARLKPDVIVTNGGPAIRAVKEAAGDIPVVMAVVDDAVALGFAKSLAHPGGNLTGLTILSTEVLGKRLELLHEVLSNPGCVAVLGLAGVNYDPDASRELAAAAHKLGVELLPVSIANINELPMGFAEIARHQCRALVVMSDPLFVGARQQLVELAAQHRVAASYDNSLIVDAGGLMSYGPNTADMFRRSAAFVDRILKGSRPADLPIERPTKFGLAINMNAAKALGLAIPLSLLARADEVIE